MEEKVNQILDELVKTNNELDSLKEKKKGLENALFESYNDVIDDKLSKTDYGTGSVKIDTAEYKITATIRKNVKWDNAKLSALADRIVAGGCNPLDYMDIKYSVPETKYKSYPDSMKQEFIDARTVTPSAPSFKIERK